MGEIRSTRRLELVDSDVCGPMQTATVGGKKYFISFTDDKTRISIVYFMREKSEALLMFREFHDKVTGESGERIGPLRTDNGGEYTSDRLRWRDTRAHRPAICARNRCTHYV